MIINKTLEGANLKNEFIQKVVVTGYDNFIKKHNGKKYILKDSIRDKDGNYHDDIIYEIVR